MTPASKPDSQKLGAILGAGFTPLFVALPAISIVGGGPLWLSIVAVIFAVGALTLVGLMIKQALPKKYDTNS